jgi:hypothetical protein
MGNPYFNLYSQTSNNEYSILNDATHELIESYGIPVKYIPRDVQNHDFIMGEDLLSSFQDVYEVNMYLENFSDFNGSGDLFAKFGMTVDDQLTLIIQQDFIDNLLGRTPLPGDLIYFEFSKLLFEIFHVDPEKNSFYHTGQQISYMIECRKFEYGGEEIETGNTLIDKINDIGDVDTSDEQDQIDTGYADDLDFTETDPFNSI